MVTVPARAARTISITPRDSLEIGQQDQRSLSGVNAGPATKFRTNLCHPRPSVARRRGPRRVWQQYNLDVRSYLEIPNNARWMLSTLFFCRETARRVQFIGFRKIWTGNFRSNMLCASAVWIRAAGAQKAAGFFVAGAALRAGEEETNGRGPVCFLGMVTFGSNNAAQNRDRCYSLLNSLLWGFVHHPVAQLRIR